MRNDTGKTIIPLVITIIILLALGGLALYFTIGENGVVKKVENEEISFNKDEVLEALNIKIRDRYLDIYGKATKDGKNNIQDFYNGDKVIMFLKGFSGGESGNDFGEQPDGIIYISDLAGHNNETESEKIYFINLENLGRTINRYGKGENIENSKDYFYIKGSGESYKVYYSNLDGEEEEIGALQIQQSL